ncbi:class I SAM-dependent methyltransferase [Streptomyces niger]|uniref:class I SAM-dependent methyltransferase n=1 Tax=Streptomyces niger TaxID=66373 RepID=UPI00069A3197|nr:class I SAM-dependent methyltransferase [Streptomyces niger]
MAFNHNDHYHPLLLGELPENCGKALDVGCGSGRFAYALAARGIDVDAIDAEAEVITAARRRYEETPETGRLRFAHRDITRTQPPRNTYDYISCLASIHHVPFRTVSALRAALRPNGVLVILGCYRERTVMDWLVSLLAVPVNAVFQAASALKGKTTGNRMARARQAEALPEAPTSAPSMTLPEIKESAASFLPGSTVRRLLFWRYLLIYRNTSPVQPQ